jgi:lysozyme
MSRPPSPTCVSFIEDVEENGVAKLTAYWDGYAAWTIGFGHTGPDIVKGTTCTRAQADAWLAEDLQASADNVDRVVRVPLNDNQRSVLISFDFNEGDGALDGSTLLRKLNGGDYASVPTELMRWVYAGNPLVFSQGLQNRRKREADLWNAPSTIAVPTVAVPAPAVPDAPPAPVPHDPDHPDHPAQNPPPVAPAWLQIIINFILALFGH